MIKSKFTRDVFIYAPSMIFVILGFILFSFRGINKEEVTIGIICILGLFLAFILLGLNFLKFIRIIKVDKKILTYFHLIKYNKPFANKENLWVNLATHSCF